MTQITSTTDSNQNTENCHVQLLPRIGRSLWSNFWQGILISVVCKYQSNVRLFMLKMHLWDSLLEIQVIELNFDIYLKFLIQHLVKTRQKMIVSAKSVEMFKFEDCLIEY